MRFHEILRFEIWILIQDYSKEEESLESLLDSVKYLLSLLTGEDIKAETGKSSLFIPQIISSCNQRKLLNDIVSLH